MEYQSHHGYDQEVMDAAYYNQPPVFLRQPVSYDVVLGRPFLMHHHDSWITFSIRHPFHPNLSETQAIVISYLLPTICVSYCKNEVKAFWVLLQLVIISFPFVCDDVNAFSFEGLRLPEELQGYHTLVPIEPSGANVERRKLGNWLSVVYRAIRTSDGIPYALRRIESKCFQSLVPLIYID